jgi:hypothetical protein
MNTKSPAVRIVGIVLLASVAILIRRCPIDGGDGPAPPVSPPAAPSDVRDGARHVDAPAGERAVLEAFAAKRSGVVVEVHGRVLKELADDDEGSRHQKFLMELAGGHTLLVSHNIDLAPRVPLDRGDEVEIRGQYEWNDRGGVLHWTHHDPRGRRPGGWIRHGGKAYE